MTDNDDDLLLFDSYINGADVKATIKFAHAAESGGVNELHYLLNGRRVERADFEAVLAASRTIDADVISEALAEEGWLTMAIRRIADNVDVEIEDSAAGKLIDAITDR